jgi:FMN phosphatase YigB (HAD superfamily)
MRKRLLVCDLDNTLYDWVSYFVPSFYAMVDEVVALTGCDREQLLDDFRVIHQKYHDSEHPFALLETKTIQRLYKDRSRAEVAQIFDSAFHRFNSSRKSTLALYPHVQESLVKLTQSGIALVAHTESNLFAAFDRLSRLGIRDFFKRIYCRKRSEIEHPNPASAQLWESKLPVNKIRELSHHQRKPNPQVLLEICADERVTPEEAAYVGDSMARDMLMARDAGVLSIWAKYGVSLKSQDYEKLVRITHWTAEDVLREKKSSACAQSMRPDFILERDFSEILPVLLPLAVSNPN